MISHFPGKYLLTALLFFFIAQQVFGQLQTYTVQPDATAGKDAYIAGSILGTDYTGYNSSNFGISDDFNATRWTTSRTYWTARSLLSFDLSNLPVNATIVSATLDLYSRGHDQQGISNAAYLRRITSGWTEGNGLLPNTTTDPLNVNGVAWNAQPAYTTAGQIALDASISNTQDYPIVVTAHVQDMVANPAANFGWVLMLQNETSTRTTLAFHSSDAADSIATKRPRLTVNYYLPLSWHGLNLFPICSGSSATLHPGIYGGPTGNYTYAWTPSSGLSCTNCSNPVASPSVTTDYSCTVTDDAQQLNITVHVPVYPIIHVNTGGSQTICMGSGSSALASAATGGLAPFTYSWSPAAGLTNTGIANPTSTATANTTYTLTVTDANGCTNTGSVFVGVTQPPTTATAGATQNICGTLVSNALGGNTPSVGTGTWTKASGPGTISFSNASSGSSTATASVIGTYVLQWTISNPPCTAKTASITVNYYSIPVITSVIPGSRCGTGTVGLGAVASAGTINWYAAATGGSSLGTGTSFTTPIISSTTTYYVDATANSCTTASRTAVAATVTTTVTPGVSIAITSGTNPSCSGNSVTFTATPVNGGAAPSYQWKVNGSNVGTNSSAFTSTTLANSNTVTCVMTSNASCISPATATSNAIVMTVNTVLTPAVAIGTSNNPSCSGSSVLFTATPVNGGAAPAYQWKVNGSNVGTNSNTFTSGTLANTNTITCVMTSNASCASPVTATSNAVTMTVNTLPAPVVTASPSFTICNGTNATLTASGGTGYSWNTGATTAALTVSPASTTSYTVTVTNANNCSAIATKTVTVNVSPTPTITASPSLTVCNGTGATLTASGGTGYTWNTGATTAAIAVSPATTSTYTVTAANAGGCTATAAKTITVNALPSISVSSSSSSGGGALATGGVITTSGAYTIHTFTTSGTFTPNGNLNVEYLVAAGGGGGGKDGASGNPGGGGGGAGGLLTGTGFAVTAQSYAITVGAGGAGSVIASTVGANGTNSVFSTIIAAGGGGGGVSWTAASAGGSGGGGAYDGSVGGAASPAGQGNKGSDGVSGNYAGAGGGGAGAAGNSPGGSGTSGTGGNGGAGSASSITGTSLMYAGGGGGGTYLANAAGSGSSGTGGNGGSNGGNGSNATASTGGGGGGGGTNNTASGNGGNGGSGIVILRYLTPVSSCGGITTLTASGASTYAWSPATGLNSTTGAVVIANPGTTTTYSVTGTNASGCTATATQTVTVSSFTLAVASSSSTICNGSSASLTASGASTYAWSPATGLNSTTGAAVIANPATTTTYTVTGTNASGCTATAAKTITVNSSLAISVSSASSGGGTSATGGVITTAGGYTIHTFTSGGTFTPNGNLNVEYLVVAGGGGGGKPGNSGNPGAGGGGAGGLLAGTLSVTAAPYTITVGAGGAGGQALNTVGTNGSNSVFSTVTATGGGGGAVSYDDGTTGGSGGGGAYSAIGGTASPGGQGNKGGDGGSGNYAGAGGGGAGAAGNNPGGSGTSGTGGNGGAGLVSSIAGSPRTYATGGGGGAYGTNTQGIGGNGISNMGGSNGGNGSDATSGEGSGGGGGGSNNTTSGNGGNGSSGIVVIRYLTPVVTCIGATTLTASGASTYVWSPSAGLNSTTGASVIASPAATTTYSVTGTNAGGCSATTTVAVTVNTPTISIASSPATICNGSSATLTASGAGTYVWSPATGLSSTLGASVLASPAATITYSVTGTNASGCSATSAKTITVNPSPAISVTSSLSGSASASGGTITTSGGYTIHTFTSGGTFTPNGNLSIEYLVVAGGGGGGKPGNAGNPGAGGGGAGGYLAGTLSVTAAPYTITVGAGGAGGQALNTAGANGSNSVFGTVTATGGGGGGVPYANGGTGGSGGGGTYAASGGTAAPAGQGNIGGNEGPGGNYAGAGGGGAGAAGNNSGGSGTAGTGGSGGAGLVSSITGTSRTYAAGGGGGAYGANTQGIGGNGISNMGGSNGGSGSNANDGEGSGGGGGGSSNTTSGNGGNGGSGIVIIRYLTPNSAVSTICSGASAVLTASGGAAYVWSTGSTSTSITAAPTSASVYSVTTANSFGCISSASFSLLVNSNCNVNYTPGYPGGGTPPPLNPALEVGTTPGSFAVSQSGAATYSIPLMTAPGTQGVVPNLAVSYNSMGGDGLLGKGWSLSGMSSISRTGQSLYYNNNVAPVTLTNADNFVMDGSHLIPASGANGAAGTVYGTEMENFSRITSVGQTGTSPNNGPDYFTVETKDGSILEFGHSADSRIEAQGSTAALTWLLSKVTDNHGNYMAFHYYENNATGEYHPDYIEYTGTGSFLPYNKIKFVYNTRTDKQKSYIAGTAVTDSVLLSAVEVHALGNKVHEYDFNYSYGMGSHLSEVIEKGVDGKQFNSTKVSWEEYYSNDIAPVTTTTFGTQSRYQGDFNGDGFSDFVTIGSNISLYLNNGNGTFPSSPSWTGSLPANYENHAIVTHGLRFFNPAVLSDFNGDGLEDLLLYCKVNGSDSYVPYYSTGSGFTAGTAFNTGNQEGNLTPPISLLGDFDGDGTTDIFVYYYTNNAQTTTTGSFFHSFSLNQTNAQTGANNVVPVDQYTIFNIVDFDGDRKYEIMVTNHSSYQVFGINFSDKSLYSVNTGNTTVNSCNSGINVRIYPGDFNGDGRTDLLTYSCNYRTWKIRYSVASSSGITYQEFDAPLYAIIPGSTQLIADYNGDGKDDIASIDLNSNIAVIYYSTGGNSFFPIAYGYNDPNINVTNVIINFALGDFNGDGKVDILSMDSYLMQDLSGIVYLDSRYVSFLKENGNSTSLNKVISITNGLNANVSIKYNTLGKLAYNIPSMYTKGNSASFPVIDFQKQESVVSSVLADNGIGGQNSTQYAYAGAQVHLQGKGFLGFTKVISTDVAANIKTENTYSQPAGSTFFQRTLSSAQTSLALTPFTPISLKTFTTYTFVPGSNLQISDPTNKRYYFYADTYNENDQLHGNVITTYTVTQDKWGNTTDQVSSNTAVTSSVHNTFELKGAWIPSRLTGTTSSAKRSSQPTYTRSVNFTNNSFGQPVTKTEDAGAITTYLYDDDNASPAPKNLGNLFTTTITGIAIPRSLANTYDSYGRFVIKQTNALNQSVQMPETEHDYYGNVTKQTDANNLPVKYAYDGFGRLMKTTVPTSTPKDISVVRSWDSSIPNSVFKVETSLPGTPTTTEYFDKLGRTLRTQTIGFNSIPVKTDKTYNSLGLLATTSEPFSGSAASGFTSYEYNDVVQRVTKVTPPSGAFTDYVYSGNSTTTTTHQTGGNKVQIKTVDASGALISATDTGGIITYTYHSSGQPLTIATTDGNVTTMVYDTYGRQISLIDHDAGQIKYDYNALGEILHQQDAQQFGTNSTYSYTLTYDALGRVTNKNSSQEGNIAYTYDNAANGIGKISTMSGLGVTYTYSYNVQGLFSGKTENLGATDGSYTHLYEYDEWNRLKKETYPGSSTPSSFATSLEYNTYGYLDKIRDANASINNPPIWQCNAMNERGQVTIASSGNGLSTYKTYSPLGYLQNIQVLESSPTDPIVRWKQDYSFDETTGNLSSRTDNTSTHSQQSESFSYDNLDRLTDIYLNGSSTPTNSIEYPGIGMGNIFSKNDAASDEYEYYGTRPHAVSGIHKPSTNIPTVGQAISYTPFNRVDNIAESSYTLQFKYGPDYERTKSTLTNNTPTGGGGPTTVRTVIYSGDYEKMTTANSTYEVYYINTPDGLAAMNVRSNGTDSMKYIYTDHLGSIDLICDQNKNKVFEQSFDAWGRERDPANWDNPNPVTAPDWLIRGYTGHEHHKEFGLINMNARMYDPVIGRMLSPDNEVQAPDFTQSYNRYSYCFNNPLKYIDPTGNDSWEVGGDGSDDYSLSPGGGGFWSNLWDSLKDFFNGNWGTIGAGNGTDDVAFSVTGHEFTFTEQRSQTSNSTAGTDFFTPVWFSFALATQHELTSNSNPAMMPIPVLNHVNAPNTQDNSGYLRSNSVGVTFDKGADNPINPKLESYFSTIMETASQQGITSVNISSTTNHPSNKNKSAHSLANGARAFDVNYINNIHVSLNNAYAHTLQNIINNTSGYMENYGPLMVNRIYNGVPVEIPSMRNIPGKHYDHIHVSVPQ